ncbi:O-antigen ligase family protein [Haloimpatiens sp. FM7315]|uniref:O-antigen ligase family protein n=1 Tax=Haloimpatiens sp. FM7315 TaxID=3298609 RepID=UPI00370A25E6
MKVYLDRIFHDNKKVIFFSLLFSAALAVLNVKKMGIKDSGMFFLATFLLVNQVYLIFKDSKKSIFLFILSLPILVTARKICSIDLVFLKITYESIYVTFLFLVKIKDIFRNLKYSVKNSSSLSFSFYIMILFFMVFVYNADIYSKDLFNSLSDTYLGVVVPIMFMISVISIIKTKDIDIIIYSLILNLDFSCLYGLMQILKDGVSLSNIKKNRALLTFGYHNVNIFAGILITILPLLMEIILYKKSSKKGKVFFYGSFMLQLIGLAITFTRGAWICFILSVFLILISKKYSKILIVLTSIGLLLSKPALSFIISRGNQNTTFFTNESSVARIQSIFTDIQILKKFPFGIGMSSFKEFYKEFAGRGYLAMPESLRFKATAAHYMLEHAHNLLLQIGVEFGLVALVIFIALIINRLRLCLKNYGENRGLFISTLIYVIFSTLTGNEFNHKGVITGTLIIFMIFALIEVRQKTYDLKSIEIEK